MRRFTEKAFLLLQWDASTAEPVDLGRRQVEECSEASLELAVRLVFDPIRSLEVLDDVVLANVGVVELLAIASHTSPSLANPVSLGRRQVKSLTWQLLFAYTKGEHEVPLAAEEVWATRVVKQAKVHAEEKQPVETRPIGRLRFASKRREPLQSHSMRHDGKQSLE